MKVIEFNPQDAIKGKAHRKENRGLNAEYSIIAFVDGKFISPITLRTYWVGGAKHYACLWINASPIHCTGSGSAGGGGYCKESAASYEAITKAGIKLSEPISGRGMHAVQDALKAIAIHLGYETFTLHKANA